ncbi:MAG: hypothetical protein A3G04_01710 [Candidatus Taylorbacteria bacterium RIFCSPLOWO2_12_FULL_44_9]|nr:MAG: hypothetical protein A3G04_01710 [Candidatus Taylorbacteria bacterium RIFCSPLOWO2_12_FULL_44_9]
MLKQNVCTVCGFIGKPKRITKGNILMELILWLFFLLPGLIYSIWRLTTRQDVCPKCFNPTMIPTDTPAGQKLVNEYGLKQEDKK